MSEKPQEKSPQSGPDFSHVDSQEKAVDLFIQGKLEKIFLMPLELGGSDTSINTLYVPPGVSSIKAGIDNNIVVPLAKVGKITEYAAIPEYQDSSFVPIAIKIEASNPSRFSTTIRIWGNALTQAPDE